MARALRGRDVIYVAPAGRRGDPWTPEPHLATRLARDNRVLWVQVPPPAITPPPQIFRPQAVGGLQVLSPPRLPSRPLQRAAMTRLVATAARRLEIEAPVLWAATAEADALLGVLRPAQIVYHRSEPSPDDLAERRFARRADAVVPALAGAETAAFARALAAGPVDPAVTRLPHPRIVVTAVVARPQLDLGLVLELARLRPEWSILLVGPEPRARSVPDLAALRAQPNVHLLGRREHAALPEVLRGADAALVPVPATARAANALPMQLLEHLAAGLPVVATPLPALREFREIRLAAEAVTAARCLDELLDGDDIEARRRRSAEAAAHSWDARIEQVAAALARAGGPLLAP